MHNGIFDEPLSLLAVLNSLLLLTLDDILLSLRVVTANFRLGVFLDFRRVVQNVVVVAFRVEHQKGLFGRLQIQLAIRRLGDSIVCQRDDIEPHALLGLAYNGVIDVPINREVVRAFAESLVGKNFAEDDLLNLVDNASRVDLLISDLTSYFLFGVGQKRIAVTCSRHVIFSHKAVEAFLHRLLLRLHVGIDAVRHEDGDVSNTRLDIVDVIDQVQHLQYVNVLFLYGVVILSGVAATHEYLLDAVVKLLLQRVEEAPERNQAAFITALDCLRSLLITRQHASLAGGKALTLVAMATDFLQHARHKLELVIDKWEAVDEVTFAGKTLEIAARILERE